MQPKEADPLSLELHERMISQTGTSLVRVKKRLKDVDMTFQLKPPEDEKMEIFVWEKKIKDLIEYKDTLDFPTIVGLKRERIKREKALAEQSASNDAIAEEKRQMHKKMAHIANERLREARKSKYFGPSKDFGVDIVGELRTIPNYNGQNSIYKGERVLVRKDGRYTRQTNERDVPPWIGPQYYSNLDPKFLAKGIFPENISKVPFVSATSSRQRIPPSSEQLRVDKIMRRNKLDSWIHRDPGPRYCHTPDVKKKLREKRVAKAETEQKGLPWDDDEDDMRREAEKYFTGDDGETVDISVVSQSPDPQAILEKTPPRIVLGDLTRQFLLVEREEKMRARAPPSKKAEFARSGPSPTKLKAISMLKQSTGFLARSPGLPAKLGRYEQGDIDEALKKRKDYTMGALSAIKGVEDAPAEESSMAPSISSVETNIDEASISVITKATGVVSAATAGGSPGAKNTTTATTAVTSNKAEYVEVVRAPHVRELVFASPIKALQIAAADEERAEEEATKRRKDEDDKKKKRLKRQKELEKEMRRKATESAVQKVLSPKNLPLSRKLGPALDSCLRDVELIYRPDEDKQKEFEATLEKIHYERRHVDAAKEKTKEEEEERRKKRHEEEGEDAAPTGDNFGDLEDLLMPGKLYTSYKNTLPSENIESIYENLVDGEAKRREEQAAAEEIRRQAKEQIILEAPDYTEANEWSDEET